MTSLVSTLALVVLTAQAPQVRRFGLFVGSNDGGPERVALRYATSDAQSVARVLEQLGGISGADASVLIAPGPDALRGAFAQLRARIEQARATGARTELIVYFSGHADEDGLLLGRARFEYPELRQLIEQVPSDVRLGIVDSCHAGALIRAKGGKKVPAFLIDDSTVVRGQAFLTASSAEEAAQESDKLGGSYFTTALLTGLRGAADSSRDGKVTLTEAYQFAFNETLAKSESSLAGPQHPAYDIRLAGTGDLVLTDVRATSAGLSVASELAGRLFLRDSKGHLVAELNKAPGYPVELGLEPGTYSVTVEISGGGLLRGEIELAEGRHVQLAPAQLAPAAREPTALRGGAPETTAPALRLNVSLVPPLALAGADHTIHFGLNLPVGLVGSLRGVEIGALANFERRDAVGLQIAGGANWVGGDVLGIQIAPLNFVGGTAGGLQVGVVDWSVADARAIQIGGLASLSGGELLGLQISGVASVAAKGGAGVQVGGVFNEADVLRGGQIAGVVNVASALKGVQLAGVVNVADEATGVQISGILNCARSASLQLGVVNIAEDSAASFGLINVVAKGYHAAFLGVTDLAPIGAAIKTGGRWGYTLIAGGTRSVQGVQRTTLTGGFGLHLDGARFFVDVEVAATEVFAGSDFLNSQRAILPATARVVGGFRIWKDLAVVVGPTLNVVTSWDGQDLDLAMPFVPRWTLADSGGVRVEMFPGFVAGLQI